LREVQDWIIRPQLKGVRDVAGVDAIGGYVKQYHVQPDPMKLVAYGLSFGDVIDALERNNVAPARDRSSTTASRIWCGPPGASSRSTRSSRSSSARKHGVTIHVATSVASEASVSDASCARFGQRNGEEAVVGTAIMLLGANSRTVAAAVDAKIPEIQRSLPADIAITTVLNRTKLVDATIATVAKNLLEGASARHRRLAPLAGQRARRADLRRGDSALDAHHGHRHGAEQGQRQPHVARRDRLRTDRRWRRDHRRELPPPTAPSANIAKVACSRSSERLHEVMVASKEM
jgi:hypothetical protein